MSKSIPRGWLLAPLPVAFIGLLTQFGWRPCGPGPAAICDEVVGGLSWAAMLFPQVLAVWTLPFLPGPALVALGAALDLAVAAAIWRITPPRVTAGRWALTWGVWLAVTTLLVWVTPDVLFGLLKRHH